MAPASKEKTQPYSGMLIVLDVCQPARENKPTLVGLTLIPNVGFSTTSSTFAGPVVHGLRECLITQYGMCTRWLQVKETISQMV